ncbi:hypothetical protein B9Z65_3215 [Elsinoe australis]|uniref:Uncharacterized protein n=1 Tax=Elsinoe australis TaxID=40998 RepID=A0A2P7ZUS4_9PEZI|nr:hypothetical protein B9Z65_3215 [Elsinoe australis]
MKPNTVLLTTFLLTLSPGTQAFLLTKCNRVGGAIRNLNNGECYPVDDVPQVKFQSDEGCL